MATPPQVLDLNQTIASLRAANQPVFNNLDTQENNVVQSGVAQTAGINASKDQAFGQITNNAATRGALFSGFTPDAQATYTGSTYLPALAKLQQAILESRTAIQGQRAGIESNISTQANNQVNDSRTALQKWQDDQDNLARQEAAAEKDRQFKEQQASLDRNLTVSENSKNRASSSANAAAAAAAKPPTANELKTALQSDITKGIQGIVNSAEIQNNQGSQGATEKLIQQLRTAYPELDPKDIATRVYQYRAPLESKIKF